MSGSIETKVREIISKNTDLKIPVDQIGVNDDLTVLGINSLDIIKIIVAIESEFCFDFDDEDLILEKFRGCNLNCVNGNNLQ